LCAQSIVHWSSLDSGSAFISVAWIGLRTTPGRNEYILLCL